VRGLLCRDGICHHKRKGYFKKNYMRKETFYFSHDYNARADYKIKKLISKHGYLGYGIYWAIVEDLYNNANALPTDYDCIASAFNVHCDVVKSIINDFQLFEINGEIFGSNSVKERLEERNKKTLKARESAFYRWKKNNADANALPSQCDSNAIKEKKEKEIKRKNIIKKKNFDKKIPDKNLKYFFYIENELIEKKFSAYFFENHNATLSALMMQNAHKKINLEEFTQNLDTQTIGYQFSNSNHVINFFKNFISKFENTKKINPNLNPQHYG
jgi:hypothetical protein